MSAPAPLTITGGLLIRPDGTPQKGGLRSADGIIVATGTISPEPGDTVIEAKGALIAPGRWPWAYSPGERTSNT